MTLVPKALVPKALVPQALVRQALRNLSGSAFRSWVVALCACLVTSFALATSLVLRGAQDSLRLANNRLGADVIVVPQGAAEKVESALLMGAPVQVWMPQETLAQVAAVPGVAQVSPQIYLSTLTGASCCSVEDMFLVAYDPATDFTVEPWLKSTIGDTLHLGEVVGGTYVFTPEGEQNISIYGYLVTLKANMEPTGTGLDQSMFLTLETARDIARLSTSLAEEPLVIPEGSISAIMVRVAPGADPYQVSVDILQRVKGISPVASPDLFQSQRRQITLLVRGLLAVMAATLGVSMVLIGMVFTLAANERQRELGILRALGATRRFIFNLLLAEAGLLALGGGLLGALLTTLVVYLFRTFIMTTLGLPFLLPAPLALLGQLGAGLAAALACVVVAASLPSLRVSRMEPALAMRE